MYQQLDRGQRTCHVSQLKGSLHTAKTISNTFNICIHMNFCPNNKKIVQCDICIFPQGRNDIPSLLPSNIKKL